MTGIQYNDMWYGLVESKVIGEKKAPRYLFRLKKAPEGLVFRTACQYTPDEIQNEFRKKRKMNMATWVTTFSIFWGLLNQEDQEQLTKLYGFDALKYSAWTALALGATGLFNLMLSAGRFYENAATTTDLIWTVASMYLLVESAMRLQKWKIGQSSGSILRILIRPFATPLLKEP